MGRRDATLWWMRNGDELLMCWDLPEDISHFQGYLSADTGIDLVKDHGRKFGSFADDRFKHEV